MIRILHVVTIMNVGGLESLIMNLYRNIDRNRIQFDFLTHRIEEGYFDKEILKLGGKIYSVPPINPLKHNQYICALDHFFSNQCDNYHIVHSHVNAWSMYVLRSAKKYDIPVRIAHSHSAIKKIDAKFIFREYCKVYIKKYATHLFSCSKEAGEYLFGKYCEELPKYHYIKNAIDANKFEFDISTRKEYRYTFGLDKENTFAVAHIGRFNYPKNHKKLIEIFAQIVNIKPNSRLLLVGKGNLEEEIRKQVLDLGIKDKVNFLNVRSDVAEILSAADAFVFPSHYEGLPLTVVEAQASGIDTYISDQITRQVLLCENIEMIPLSNSAEQWAKIIINKYSSNKHRQNRYKEIVKAGFDVKSNVEWITNFYETVNNYSFQLND